ncbi:MAG: outer membrane beta-barrel protein [Bacteroidota bacterium]
MLNSIIRLTAICLLVFVSTATAHAQIKVVPKVGYQLAGVDATIPDFDAEARGGWQLGADLRLGKGFLYVNPGFHFAKTTLELRDNFNLDNPFDLSEEATVQTFKLPLLLGLRLPNENNLLNVRLRGGITPSYITSAEDTERFEFSVDQFNRLNWAATAGVGVDVLFFTADLTFEKGLRDYYEAVEGSNNILTLSLGVKF